MKGRDRVRTALMIICGLAVIGMIFLYASAYAQDSYGGRHPVEVERAICSECHADKWPDMDHALGWYGAHRFASQRAGWVCTMCHSESYCTDCHPNKSEIKPSDRHKESPERELPHRGDYITRHRIDARLNPAPCFRCHGRQNNEGCRICHR